MSECLHSLKLLYMLFYWSGKRFFMSDNTLNCQCNGCQCRQSIRLPLPMLCRGLLRRLQSVPGRGGGGWKGGTISWLGKPDFPVSKSLPQGRLTDGSTVSVNSREGCVTKCGANFLNNFGHLIFARSPAKPVLTFLYTCYSLWRHILANWTHRISRRNYTFYAQFPKLTTIRCKRHRFFPWRHDHTRAS